MTVLLEADAAATRICRKQTPDFPVIVELEADCKGNLIP